MFCKVIARKIHNATSSFSCFYERYNHFFGYTTSLAPKIYVTKVQKSTKNLFKQRTLVIEDQ
jgi:hypothetical protein